ncbi:MAG: 6-carboxytetrahydropterin synthase QueD [Planctomycetes bacterium]|nr:6-carboxytetrahydropterin synthase QueD [Planctomycetota bacterium]
MSYELFVTAEFSAAHNLRNYKGKCERLHGHNWRVDLRLRGGLNREGMVLDFVEVKRILAEVLDPFDHAYLNETPPFDRLNPSSENLARIIAGAVAKRLPRGVRVASVTCWESARCAATYKQTKVQSSKFKVQS